MVTITELTNEMIALYDLDRDDARRAVLACVDELIDLIDLGGREAVMAAPGAISDRAADALRQWFYDVYRA